MTLDAANLSRSSAMPFLPLLRVSSGCRLSRLRAPKAMLDRAVAFVGRSPSLTGDDTHLTVLSMSGAPIPVLIAGGGPVGLALAIELGMAGIECLVVERRDGTISIPKMSGLSIRSMEFN